MFDYILITKVRSFFPRHMGTINNVYYLQYNITSHTDSRCRRSLFYQTSTNVKARRKLMHTEDNLAHPKPAEVLTGPSVGEDDVSSGVFSGSSVPELMVLLATVGGPVGLVVFDDMNRLLGNDDVLFGTHFQPAQTMSPAVQLGVHSMVVHASHDSSSLHEASSHGFRHDIATQADTCEVGLGEG